MFRPSQLTIVLTLAVIALTVMTPPRICLCHVGHLNPPLSTASSHRTASPIQTTQELSQSVSVDRADRVACQSPSTTCCCCKASSSKSATERPPPVPPLHPSPVELANAPITGPGCCGNNPNSSEAQGACGCCLEGELPEAAIGLARILDNSLVAGRVSPSLSLLAQIRQLAVPDLPPIHPRPGPRLHLWVCVWTL